MRCCSSFFFFSKVNAGAGHSSLHFDDLIFKNQFLNLSPFTPVHIHLMHEVAIRIQSFWVGERVSELAHKD